MIITVKHRAMKAASDLLCCLFIGLFFCYCCGHRCVHDKIASHSILHKINLEDSEQRSTRAAVSSSYGTIRIMTHVVHKYVSKKHRSKLQDRNGVLQRAAKQLGSVLRVKRSPQISFPLQCSQWLAGGACLLGHVIPMRCGSSPVFDIPLDHMSQMRVCSDVTETNCTTVGGGGIASVDLIIYITAINHRTACGDDTIAYATHCVLDSGSDNRPVAGVVNICPRNFWKRTTNEQYHYKVLLHELTHILVFSDQLYPHFAHAQGESVNVARRSFYNGQEVAKIITTNVVAWGRQHFNCDKLEGVMLQLSPLIGWLGSHWSHLLLEEEYMSPTITQITGEVKLISNFTLALFQDSGWYEVDYNITRMWKQPNKFAGGGCALIESCPVECSSSDDHSGCSHDGLTSAVCNKYQLTLNCPSYQTSLGYSCTDINRNSLANHNRRYEVLGEQSRCFALKSTTDSVRYGHCLQYQCYQLSHAHLYALKVFIPIRSVPYCHGDGNLLTCSERYKAVWCREGAELKLPNRYGSITCPKASQYCSYSNKVINIDYIPPSMCDDSCATCFKPYDPAQCTSCHRGYKLNGNFTSNCLPRLAKCWGASYYDNNAARCKRCPDGCAVCTTSTDCLKCSDHSHYLTNGLSAPDRCVPSCEGVGLLSYINSTNQRRQCYVCLDVNCDGCDISGRCSKCRLPYQLYDGHCVLKCPNGTIAMNNKCHACPLHCQQCSSVQWCTTCNHGYQLAAGFCVVKCPSTFYSINSTHCDECSEGCGYCIRPSSCRLCNTGYHSHNQNCVKECPSGYFSSTDHTRRLLYCRPCDRLWRLLKICT